MGRGVVYVLKTERQNSLILIFKVYCLWCFQRVVLCCKSFKMFLI